MADERNPHLGQIPAPENLNEAFPKNFATQRSQHASLDGHQSGLTLDNLAILGKKRFMQQGRSLPIRVNPLTTQH